MKISVNYVESVENYQMYLMPSGELLNLGGRSLPF